MSKVIDVICLEITCRRYYNIIIQRTSLTYNAGQAKENSKVIEVMEVNYLKVGDGDKSDTPDSDWGSDFEDSHKV